MAKDNGSKVHENWCSIGNMPSEGAEGETREGAMSMMEGSFQLGGGRDAK